MRSSSSSKSMTEATCRPRSKSVSRISRSLDPANTGRGDSLGGDVEWLMKDGTGVPNDYTGLADMSWTLPLDYTAIERILPHRYPFLLVDRVTELEPDKRI